MKKQLLLIAVFLMVGGTAISQSTIKGVVLDMFDNPVPNANIEIPALQVGTYTNTNGEFTLSVGENGTFKIRVSHVSFQSKEQNIELPTVGDISFVLDTRVLLADQVVIKATRADDTTPTTFTNVSADELQDQNFGQDIPVLLELTPSVVSTTDAGAGIGYTGIRIRGSDATRINVTINGVPLNDSESHGVFWVNTPDLASSTESIQIQRGVGTSTNGAAAFGATINLMTNKFEVEPYAEISSAVGSFNSFKNTLRFGSGLLNDKWSFDARLSRISSDGYIDRARADLMSYYLSGVYSGKNTTVRLLTFAGLEETYQAWWGTPEARINNDVDGMNAVIGNNGWSTEQAANLLNSGRTFNYYLYDNEVDHYQQDHYQLHISQSLSDKTTLSGALHYTYGRGYFEQFKDGEDFADYDLSPIPTLSGDIDETDLIRRRWLDNHFYGLTYSLIQETGRGDITIGGGYNNYQGDHFGEVTWAQYAPNIPIRHRYYDNTANKSDFNVYAKTNVLLGENINLYADVQFRTIGYTAEGPDADRIGGVPFMIDLDETYSFFNPKVGLTYTPSADRRYYLSFAVANREPVRSDFIDNQTGTLPRPETLNNFEAGGVFRGSVTDVQVNAYYMGYKDQLVLTGAVNDVGAAIRTNVENSYRAGIELSATTRINSKISWIMNATASSNKIASFEEVLYDYGLGWDEFNEVRTTFENTDIAFSPSWIGASQVVFTPGKAFELAFISKYVGKQFLDNTSNDARSIDAYFVNHLRASWNLEVKGLKELEFGLQVNNIFNHLFESNGYTFGYSGGGFDIRENYYYPQAGRNLMFSTRIKF